MAFSALPPKIQSRAYAEQAVLLRNYLRIVIGAEDERLRRVMEDIKSQPPSREAGSLQAK